MYSYFPKADTYASILRRGSLQASEAPVASPFAFHWSERHLQCLWFDARLRPTTLPLPNGESVTILNPGDWNLEAGPDFHNADLLIQPGERHLHGDVEVHIRPTDWDAHAHRHQTNYRNVVAHVTWFATPPPHTLPPHVLALPLAPIINTTPGISLDDIDIKAYPHAFLPTTPRPCELHLREQPDRAMALLTAAGQYRLRWKCQRFLTRLAQIGCRHQVFYEEFMAALGYKHNQTPCRLLAKVVPVASLSGCRDTTLARLLGAANLLPQPTTAPDAEGQQMIRKLWDLWWRETSPTLPNNSPSWCHHNLRPHNSLVRRLAAAAALFSGICTIHHDIDNSPTTNSTHWFKQIAALIDARCNWPFWQHRLTLSAPPSPKPSALIGTKRIAAITTNVILPFAIAEARLPKGFELNLPPEDLSAPMRLTAWRLFGRDHNPALYANNGLLQQGLLQIYLDFCLNAKPHCDACELHAALAAQQLPRSQLS